LGRQKSPFFTKSTEKMQAKTKKSFNSEPILGRNRVAKNAVTTTKYTYERTPETTPYHGLGFVYGSLHRLQ
jgi:hypothetical protein